MKGEKKELLLEVGKELLLGEKGITSWGRKGITSGWEGKGITSGGVRKGITSGGRRKRISSSGREKELLLREKELLLGGRKGINSGGEKRNYFFFLKVKFPEYLVPTKYTYLQRLFFFNAILVSVVTWRSSHR